MPRGGARPGAGRKPGVKSAHTKQMVSVRLKPDLVSWLKKTAKSTGTSQAKLIDKALRKTFKIK